MRLKDVRAVEIFNAMDLYFQANKIQAQWTLMLNGTRPTAVLAVLHPAKPPGDATPSETERKHTVFSIADISSVPLAEERGRGTAWITYSISMVLGDTQKPGHAAVNAPGGPDIKIHQDAGLLVFTGTAEETEFGSLHLGSAETNRADGCQNRRNRTTGESGGRPQRGGGRPQRGGGCPQSGGGLEKQSDGGLEKVRAARHN